MGYRENFKKENPQFDKINKIIPMDIHHNIQQCDGGTDNVDNLSPMLSGRHENHKHHKKGQNLNLDAEDYLFYK